MSKSTQNASGNGKSRSLIFIIMIVMLIGLCALGGFAMYQIYSMKSEMRMAGHPAPEEKKPVPAPVPIYVPLDAFTVSLKPGGTSSDRVLYIGLTLRLKSENDKTLLSQFMPEIRSRLLLLFSQQTGEDLETDAGKVELLKKIKNVVNLPLADQHSVIVTDVLFNAFILR